MLSMPVLFAAVAALCTSLVFAGADPCLSNPCPTAPKNTAANIKFVQFPASYNSMMANSSGLYHGFTYSWRRKCEGKCGDSGKHHFMSVVPTRAANIAAASCWCCIKNPKTGECYNKSSPYSSTDVVGPYTLMSDIVIAKMNPAVKEVAESVVNAVSVPVFTVPTKKPTAGKSIMFRWKAPASELIDAKLYAKFTAGSKTATVMLNKKTYDCIVPANIYGSKVSVVLCAGGNQKSSYQVASGSVKIGKPVAKRDHIAGHL